MLLGEKLYLLMVLASFTIFGITLAYASHRQAVADRAAQRAPQAASGSLAPRGT